MVLCRQSCADSRPTLFYALKSLQNRTFMFSKVCYMDATGPSGHFIKHKSASFVGTIAHTLLKRNILFPVRISIQI